jgi:uncharacterized protein YacL
MWLVLFRAFLLAILAHAGWVYTPFAGNPAAGAVLGAILGVGVIALELRVRAVPGHHMVGALVGGVTGLVGARLVWGALAGLELAVGDFVHMFLVVFLCYIGVVVGGLKGEWFEPARLIAAFRDSARLQQYKVLDTSVIIDGRIADICETGFLEGTLVVPQFVLRELQQVADSSDSLKRNRGRRGLDILQKIQKMAGVHVQIVETDFPEIREVDLKLIELARKLQGKIVTNDFNLNKVAQLRGVQVLNINELANSLKPVVLPGEVMRVFMLKEGKEPGQGVGYLDDGTMVVVDQGKRALGKTIEVTVTSVLQTTAGKMIFCRWPEAPVVPGEDTGRRSDTRPGRNGRDRREGGGTDRFAALDRSAITPVPGSLQASGAGAVAAAPVAAREERADAAREPAAPAAPPPGSAPAKVD